jgi:hypothetical protein
MVLNWLRKLRRKPPPEVEPAVERAEQKQQQQFGEWADTMQQVRRVEKLAEKPVRSHR